MWDPSAGDPKICDLQNQQLETLDALIIGFCAKRNVLLESNYHNFPGRRIFEKGDDGVYRQIEVIPIPGTEDLPISGQFWLSGGASYDEDKMRWIHWFPKEQSPLRTRKLLDLQQHLPDYLEMIWCDLNHWNQEKLKKTGDVNWLSH